MPYVLKKGPLFVSRPGMASSYTLKEEDAQTFDSIAAAESHRCPDNEVIAWMNRPMGWIPGTPWRNPG